MKITNYITLLIGAFLICSSPLAADEYITLNAKIDYTNIVILDKNASDFGGNTYYEKALEEQKQIVANSDIKLKDEVILELDKGEVIELGMMFDVYYNAESKPQIPEIGQTHSWWSRETLEGANGGHKLEVKYPGHDSWFQLRYDTNANRWTGLGINNPKIVGPCILKLTKNAHIVFFETSNHGNQTEKQHYLTQYEGGNVWVTLKKLRSTSSTGTSTAQSLVLPEGSGDLTIIMEGSNDLINWTREDLGKKPEANRKTFYRIRAVKE